MLFYVCAPAPLSFIILFSRPASVLWQAEELLTYTIHPPERLVQSIDENGAFVDSYELEKEAFLEVGEPLASCFSVSPFLDVIINLIIAFSFPGLD